MGPSLRAYIGLLIPILIIYQQFHQAIITCEIKNPMNLPPHLAYEILILSHMKAQVIDYYFLKPIH